MKRPRLSNRIRRALPGHSRGFALIEVVIAIALMGMIGITILSALSTATLALIIADQRATAESLARSQMEYVKNSDSVGYDEVNDPPQYSPDWTGVPDGYDIDIAAVRLDPEDDGLGDDDGIQEITVTVTYYFVGGDSSMREREYVLVDYKRKPDEEPGG